MRSHTLETASWLLPINHWYFWDNDVATRGGGAGGKADQVVFTAFYLLGVALMHCHQE